MQQNMIIKLLSFAFVVTCFAYVPPVLAVEWQTDIMFHQSDGQSFGIHTFGMTNGASEGWDGNLVDAVAYPPAAIGKAYFEITSSPPLDKLSRDMRGPADREEWKLCIDPSGSSWSGTWDLTHFIPGSSVYLQEVGRNYTNSIGVALDMLASTTKNIPSGAHYYRISFTIPEPTVIYIILNVIILLNYKKLFLNNIYYL